MPDGPTDPRPTEDPPTAEATDQFYAALLDNDPQALYDRAPCGYLSSTPEGTIIQVNQTFLTLTGYARDELVGRRTFASLLSAGGRIYHETHYAPLLQMHGTAREIAFEIVRADGTRLPALVNSVLERDTSGDPLVVRAAIFDATDRREYERELLRAKERAEQSEAKAQLLARTLQDTLIPPAPPQIPGLDVAATYRPAGSGDEVGGDFYDVFEVAEDDWVVAIGDVLGKGVDAAVVTTLARYSIRAAAVRLERPSEVLANLNAVLLHHPTERFCTALVMRLQRRHGRWKATISSGGHPLALVTAGGAPPATFGRPGSLVGALDEVEFFDDTLELSAGASVVLYTDGVTEGRRRRDFFDDERLLESIARYHRGGAGALATGILGDVLDFQSGNPRDDIAIVAVSLA